MMIAPQASTSDGLIEYVRWGPIGRLGLLRNFPTLFDGTHIRHPLASRARFARIEFALEDPVDVMMDGEVLHAGLPKDRSASRRAGRAGMRTSGIRKRSCGEAKFPARAESADCAIFGCAAMRWWILAAAFSLRFVPALMLLGVSSIRARTTRRSAGYRARWCGLRGRKWRCGGRRDSIRSELAFSSPTTSICSILSCFTARFRNSFAGWSWNRIFASLSMAG